jgi:predicted nucleic acid-binding protein
MSDRFFLDTNVFVYEDTPTASTKRAIATRLIDRAFVSGKGVISFQIVQEYFSVAFRRFQPRMSFAEAQRKLDALAPLLAVHSSFSLYQRALDLSRRFSLSWYDSLIVAAALEANCRTLYTEDLQHGQVFDNLRVQNPFL